MSQPDTVYGDVPAPLAKATFAGGCFWCTEAVYAQLKGVQSVTSGYTSGTVLNPTYEQVCSGRTGHAEGVERFEQGLARMDGEIGLVSVFGAHASGGRRS